MSKYTTTTGEVREAFIEAGPWTMNGGAALKAFEQWLAAHDAEVWDEGFNAGYDQVLVNNSIATTVIDYRKNPYRQESS